jgi:spore coat protein H
MRKVLRTILAILGGIFLVIVSLNSLTVETNSSAASQASQLEKKVIKEVPAYLVPDAGTAVPKVSEDINSLPLRDNLELYDNQDPGSVVTMYMTVRRGNDSENTNHSWAEVNSSTKYIFASEDPIVVPKAEAILQVGDEKGPLPSEFGYGQLVPNATVQIRGSTTSLAAQKSYKVELYKSAGLWRGQGTIDLNKHIFDVTRSKNKLSFDLMQMIPNMVSLRTQFVHLYVKDETVDPPGKAFVDYGLFTQIEQPNTRFLKNHMLDRFAQFYKATLFEFFRYPDQIRLADDPLYDEAAFQRVLEIKGNKDHTKLIQMLDDVNNFSIPIDTTFHKYFNEDNYFTWLAFNILVENYDTGSQNFYLYSPQNSQVWYFLPWDYDGAFARVTARGTEVDPNFKGLVPYWGNVLHRRVLMVPENRAKLDRKLRALLAILTPRQLNNMLNVYRKVTDQYVDRMPDELNLPGTLDWYDRAYSLIPDEPRNAYQLYQESLQSPMPFHLGTPVVVGNNLRFDWGDAYDFQAQDIVYDFQVSKDWEFRSLVAEQSSLNGNRVEIPMLGTGEYFWRVTATNEAGKSQVAFDDYLDNDRQFHFGMKYLYISPDGQILERQSQ